MGKGGPAGKLFRALNKLTTPEIDKILRAHSKPDVSPKNENDDDKKESEELKTEETEEKENAMKSLEHLSIDELFDVTLHCMDQLNISASYEALQHLFKIEM